MADGFHEMPVRGKRRTNNAAVGDDSVATIPAVANNAAPAHTEGNVVALSTDLAGQLRVRLSTTGGSNVVALDTASLAALESIDLNAATVTSLRDISDRAARALGVVSLDTATLAALESIDLNAATLAALESVDLNTATRDDIVSRITAGFEASQVTTRTALESVDLNSATLTTITTTPQPLSVRGATVADTNPLPVMLQENPGSTVDSGLLTSVNLAPGASVTLSGPAVGAGLTGKLLEITASSSVRIKVEVRANGVARRVFFADPAGTPLAYSPKDRDLLTVAATQVFSLVITNQDNLRTADVYGSIAHVEV